MKQNSILLILMFAIGSLFIQFVSGQDQGSDVSPGRTLGEILNQARAARTHSSELTRTVSVLLERSNSESDKANLGVQNMASLIENERRSLHAIQFELSEWFDAVGDDRDVSESNFNESVPISHTKLLPHRPSASLPHQEISSDPKHSVDQETKKTKSATVSNRSMEPDASSNAISGMAVANNLVQLGNLDSAIKIYEKLLAQNKLETLDQKWVLLQLARCYRLNNGLADAEKNLRALGQRNQASLQINIDLSEENELLSSTADWWLNQMDRRRRLEEELNR